MYIYVCICICIYIYIGGKYMPFPFGVVSLRGVQNQDFVFSEVGNPGYILGVWTHVLGLQMGPGPGPNLGASLNL